MAQCYFPEEIITEILRRLPVKSLLRFRCVKKSWYSLIHTPQFMTLHSSYQKNPSKDKYLLFVNCITKLFSLRFDNDNEWGEYYSPKYLPGMPKQLMWHATSNGLICFCAMSAYKRNTAKFFYRQIYIWNPAIAKYITLPLSASKFRFNGAKLAFGFVPKYNDYKVIKIVYDPYGKLIVIEVYSLSTNSWKIINQDNIFRDHNIKKNQKEVFVNGAVFWIGRTKGCKTVVCFDTENEVMRQISLPLPEHYGKHRDISIQAIGESLALFVENKVLNVVDMWVSQEIGDRDPEVSWKTKMFTVDLRKKFHWQVVGVRNNCHDLVIVLDKRYKQYLLSYNLVKKVTKKCVDSLDLQRVNLSNYTKFVSVNPFTESLILLNTIAPFSPQNGES